MDEIIIEALEYITPKKVDEALVNEANKKAAVKKTTKIEEVVSTDPFEGKDSVEYKNLANKMKA
jgi:Txe/YoeB family toxin of Txe-Axe toxin-antitoxin module